SSQHEDHDDQTQPYHANSLRVSVRENRGESADEPRPDRLSAEPAESQRERRRPPDLGLELHRIERRRQAGQPRARVPGEREPSLVALHQDHFQSDTGAEGAELGDEEQALRVIGKRSEPIPQFLAHRLNLARRLGPRQPPVQLELHRFIRHVFVGEARRQIQAHLGWHPRSWYSCASPSWSARFTIMVFAFGTSSPDSTIIVDTRTSTSPRTNRAITASSSASLSFPCATAIRARGGARARTRSAIVSIVSIRLYTKYTCPPRSSSRASASSFNPSSHGSMNVSTGERSLGGV